MFIIRSLCFLAFVLLVLMTTGHAGFAQETDTAIKPLPDFIQERPEIKAPPPVRRAPNNTSRSDIAAPDRPDEERPSDLSEIPDEYIIEASEFGEMCRNEGDMRNYYDCRCMAIKYLDARIEFGPDVGPSFVKTALVQAKDCKDATGIAGHIYERCLLDINNAPTHLDPEEYCSCYGNTFAKYFENISRNVTLMAKINLKTRAQLRCRDPIAAQRIYGGDPVGLR
ncbi:MAG: hypothetical protein AB8B83_09650 [Bdellovibrionales bacterium]